MHAQHCAWSTFTYLHQPHLLLFLFPVCPLPHLKQCPYPINCAFNSDLGRPRKYFNQLKFLSKVRILLILQSRRKAWLYMSNICLTRQLLGFIQISSGEFGISEGSPLKNSLVATTHFLFFFSAHWQQQLHSPRDAHIFHCRRRLNCLGKWLTLCLLYELVSLKEI